MRAGRGNRLVVGVLGLVGAGVAVAGVWIVAGGAPGSRSGEGFSSGFVLGMGVFMTVTGIAIVALAAFAARRPRPAP